MKLLLDMGVSPRTAHFLRMRGHDAVHLRELGLNRTSDEEIADLAQNESRVVVTFDLDFSRIVALESRARPSLIVFRLERFTTDQVNAQLIEIIDRYVTQLEAGSIITVHPDRIRVRKLPLW